MPSLHNLSQWAVGPPSVYASHKSRQCRPPLSDGTAPALARPPPHVRESGHARAARRAALDTVLSKILCLAQGFMRLS